MHIGILSGTANGGTAPRNVSLIRVLNTQTIGGLRLEYVETDSLALTRVVNSNTIENTTLTKLTTHTLTQTHVTNANTISPIEIALIPYEPDNTETDTLLAAFDQNYSTTAKKQMDILITGLKTGGFWARGDWYGNAHWALSEHDALINWINPAQTLVKVGSASWTLGQGLKGVNPVTSNSRYKSGYTIGAGQATGTDFSFFTKVTAIDVPQNGMQPMGMWRLVTGGGPATADGEFLSLSVVSNSGFAGAALASGNGNTSFTPGDGLGVWGVSHDGPSQITVRNGVTLETDSVSGTSTYADADGMSVAGSSGNAKRSFPGMELYWGWGKSLSAAQFGALETAFAIAQLPPEVAPTEPPETLVNSAFSSLDKSTNITLSLADLKATATASGDQAVRLVDGKRTGKYYFEFTAGQVNGGDTMCGLLGPGAILNVVGGQGNRAFMVAPSGHVFLQNTNVIGINGYSPGSVICVAVDLDARLGWMRINNGSWNATSGTTNNPATGVGGLDLSAILGLGLWPGCSFNSSGDNFTINVGDSANAFTAPSGFNNQWLQSSKHELRVDPGVTATKIFTGTNTNTIPLNTQKNDTMVMLNFYGEQNVQRTVTSVTDTTGLTWARKGQYQFHSTNSFNIIETWYAFAPTPISGATITVNLSGSIDDAAMITHGFIGYNSAAPFDTNVSLPVQANGNSGQAMTAISTDGTEGIAWGVMGSEVRFFGATEGMAGFAMIGSADNGGGGLFAHIGVAGHYYTSAMSSVALSFEAFNLGSKTWVMMTDCVVK